MDRTIRHSPGVRREDPILPRPRASSGTSAAWAPSLQRGSDTSPLPGGRSKDHGARRQGATILLAFLAIVAAGGGLSPRSVFGAAAAWDVGPAAMMMMSTALAVEQQATREEIEVIARVSSRTMFVGEPFELEIRVAGAEPTATPDVTALANAFDVTLTGSHSTSSQSIVIVNGRRQQTSFEGWVYRFRLVPREVGSIVIPPVVVAVDGVEHASNPIEVRVNPPTPHELVGVRMSLSDDEPFVGEAVTLRVTLLLRSRFQNADISIPGFGSSFLTLETEPSAGDDDLTRRGQWPRNDRRLKVPIMGEDVPVEQGSEIIQGQQYTTYVAERLVVPIAAGDLTIGPAILSGQIIVRDALSMFGEPDTERVAVPSDPLHIRVRPVPDVDRPDNYSGLVGDFTLSANASPGMVNVGDPVELQVIVRNRDGVTPDPKFDFVAASGLEDDFRVQPAAPEATSDGAGLVYRWTIRPLRAEVEAIPGFELPYFDADAETFAFARTAPIPLDVRSTRSVTLDDAVRSNEPTGGGRGSEGGRDAAAAIDELEVRERGIAHNYIGADLLVDRRFDLAATLRSPVWIAVLAGPPLAWLAGTVMLGLRRRRLATAGIRRRSRALQDALALLPSLDAEIDGSERASAMVAAVRTYVSQRFERSAAALTIEECGDLVRTVDAERGGALQAVLERCDAARYGVSMASDQAVSLQQSVTELLRAVDRPAGRSDGPSASGGAGKASPGARRTAGVLGALLVLKVCSGGSGWAFAGPVAGDAPMVRLSNSASALVAQQSASPNVGAFASATASPAPVGASASTAAAARLEAAEAAFEAGMRQRLARRTGSPAAGPGADAAAARASFEQAIALWRQVIEVDGIENGGLHYNIGNAHLMLGDVGKAIASYRRAQVFLPHDINVVQNLTYARSQVPLNLGVPAPPAAARVLFFWHYDVPVQLRFHLFIASLTAAWVWLLLRLGRAWRSIAMSPAGSAEWVRPAASGGGGVADGEPAGVGRRDGWRLPRWPAVVLFAVAFTMLGSVVWTSVERDAEDAGVVTAETVMGRKGPSESGYEPTFREPLPAGVEFRVVEDRGAWMLIRLANDRETWIPADAATRI